MTHIREDMPSDNHLTAKQAWQSAGDNAQKEQWYSFAVTVRALKASQAMGTVRAYAGEVEFLWSGLASCHSLLLRIFNTIY